LVAAEHVPNRMGECARELDTGDFRAALLAEPTPGLLVAAGVGGVSAGVAGRLDQRVGCANPASGREPVFVDESAQSISSSELLKR
jgi:hypothetical protein